MPVYIGLLRGINVGGHNKLPMADLRATLASLGLADIKTYIQSGNVVFRSERRSTKKLAIDLSAAIETEHGFRPETLVLMRDQYEKILRANPFPEAVENPKSLHVFFLQKPAASDVLQNLKLLLTDDERIVLTDEALYLHAPIGIGRSKLAAKAESLLGVATTARNWRTATKVLELAMSIGD